MKGLEKNGTVKVNGTKIGKEISLISGFAQQQEIFIPTLTVDEYLMIQVSIFFRTKIQYLVLARITFFELMSPKITCAFKEYRSFK